MKNTEPRFVFAVSELWFSLPNGSKVLSRSLYILN